MSAPPAMLDSLPISPSDNSVHFRKHALQRRKALPKCSKQVRAGALLRSTVVVPPYEHSQKVVIDFDRKIRPEVVD